MVNKSNKCHYSMFLGMSRADNELNQLENSFILDLIIDSLNLVHESNESNLS